MGNEVTGLDWSGDRSIPAFQAPEHLDLYDIRGASRDVQLAVATTVGIINRPQPRVYLITGDDDAFWPSHAFYSVPQDVSPRSGNDVLEALISAYHGSIQGLIIYDPNLIDTVNIATMLAGQRDGMVVSPAQAQDLHSAHNLPIIVDLRTYQWRSRLQAYHWAQQNLLSGCSSRMVAGLDGNSTTGLRSFLVATRTFVYWLDSRKYLPDLSDGLLSERSLMQQIIGSFPPGAVHLGWFIDESSGVNLTSIAAMVVLATDFFTNMEVWAALQPETTTTPVQASPPLTTANKVYVSFTMSEGDNLQYVQHRMMHLWRDAARGTLPIGWTFSPVLRQAAPAMAEYYISTLTSHDELIAGPSGAGYMFPSHWPAEQLSRFLQRSGQLMQAMNMTTLEVLDTDFWQSSGLPFISSIRLTGMAFTDEAVQESFVRELVPFGLKGIVSGSGLLIAKWKKVDNVPLYHNLGLADSVSAAVKLIKGTAITHPRRPLFLNVYILAWSMTPADLSQVVQQLGDGYEIVLPRTLLAMLAETI